MADSPLTRLPRRAVRAIRRRLRRRQPGRLSPRAARARMDRPEDLYEFWRQPEPVGNRPYDYIGPRNRSKVLHQLVSDLPPEARILEVGCNVGRNLAYLHDNGYPGVEGIEISPHAVEMLRKTYPQLADVTVHVGPAADLLPEFADDQFDLVYTMAVLEHIHPDQAMVFDQIVRVGRSVLAIEPPGDSSHRHYPWDIPKEFTRRGLRLVSSMPMRRFPETAADPGIKHFVAHRFTRA